MIVALVAESAAGAFDVLDPGVGRLCRCLDYADLLVLSLVSDWGREILSA